MSRRPLQHPIGRLAKAQQRMAPGGLLWSESPIPRRYSPRVPMLGDPEPAGGPSLDWSFDGDLTSSGSIDADFASGTGGPGTFVDGCLVFFDNPSTYFQSIHATLSGGDYRLDGTLHVEVDFTTVADDVWEGFPEDQPDADFHMTIRYRYSGTTVAFPLVVDLPHATNTEPSPRFYCHNIAAGCTDTVSTPLPWWDPAELRSYHLVVDVDPATGEAICTVDGTTVVHPASAPCTGPLPDHDGEIAIDVLADNVHLCHLSIAGFVPRGTAVRRV